MDWSVIQSMVILTTGAGLYLRLVTKEKQRREKHLQLRLDEQLRQLREEKERLLAAQKAREEEDKEARERALKETHLPH